MNRLLLLSLLCFAAYASAVDYGKGFSYAGFFSSFKNDFYEICPDDQFEYNHLNVNAVFTIRGLMDTFEIGYYAVDESVDYHQLFNQPEADQLEAIKDDYHNRLKEMFGEEYLNDPSYKENVIGQKLAALREQVIGFWGKGKNPFVADMTLGKQINKMIEAQNFSQVLHAFKTDRAPALTKDVMGLFETRLFYTGAAVDALEVFGRTEIADRYNDGIFQFDRFKPMKSSKLFNGFRKDYGEVHFKMQIPLRNRKSKWVVPSRPCLKAKQLPTFYQLKGKVDN